MKNLLFLVISLLPASLFAQNNSLQPFFEKYSGKDGFTTVKISPGLFNLIALTDMDEAEIVKDITGVNILIMDNEDGDDKTVEKSKQLYKEAQGLIGSGYEELMSVKEHNTDLKILARSAGEGIVNDLLIVGNDDGEFIYVNVTGKIDLKKIDKLSKCTDIKGLDQLEKLDDPGKK